MELKNLFTEERAVSPVIAVVLMIAVTVILAAIVAAFALGLGGGADQTPQASFDYDWSGTDLVITHEGGDSLPVAQIDVLTNGVVVAGGAWAPTGDITTGSSYTFTTQPVSGDEIRIRYTGNDGQTATLSVYEVP